MGARFDYDIPIGGSTKIDFGPFYTSAGALITSGTVTVKGRINGGSVNSASSSNVSAVDASGYATWTPAGSDITNFFSSIGAAVFSATVGSGSPAVAPAVRASVGAYAEALEAAAILNLPIDSSNLPSELFLSTHSLTYAGAQASGFLAVSTTAGGMGSGAGSPTQTFQSALGRDFLIWPTGGGLRDSSWAAFSGAFWLSLANGANQPGSPISVYRATPGVLNPEHVVDLVPPVTGYGMGITAWVQSPEGLFLSGFDQSGGSGMYVWIIPSPNTADASQGFNWNLVTSSNTSVIIDTAVYLPTIGASGDGNPYLFWDRVGISSVTQFWLWNNTATGSANGTAVPLWHMPSIRQSPTSWTNAGSLTFPTDSLTLSSNITTTGQTTFNISSPTSIVANTLIRIGNEEMLVTIAGSNPITVTRGYNGTTKSTYNSGAAILQWSNVSMSLASQPVVLGDGGGTLRFYTTDIPSGANLAKPVYVDITGWRTPSGSVHFYGPFPMVYSGTSGGDGAIAYPAVTRIAAGDSYSDGLTGATYISQLLSPANLCAMAASKLASIRNPAPSRLDWVNDFSLSDTPSGSNAASMASLLLSSNGLSSIAVPQKITISGLTLSCAAANGTYQFSTALLANLFGSTLPTPALAWGFVDGSNNPVGIFFDPQGTLGNADGIPKYFITADSGGGGVELHSASALTSNGFAWPWDIPGLWTNDINADSTAGLVITPNVATGLGKPAISIGGWLRSVDQNGLQLATSNQPLNVVQSNPVVDMDISVVQGDSYDGTTNQPITFTDNATWPTLTGWEIVMVVSAISDPLSSILQVPATYLAGSPQKVTASLTAANTGGLSPGYGYAYQLRAKSGSDVRTLASGELTCLDAIAPTF